MSVKKRAHGPESLMEFHKGKEQHHLLPRILLLPSLFFPIAYSSGLHEDANEVDFQRIGVLGRTHMRISAICKLLAGQERASKMPGFR